MMQRSRFNDNFLIELKKKVEDLEAQLELMRNRKVVTLPVYNKASLPVGVLATEGAVFIGTDNTLNIVRGGVVKSTAALT